MEKDPPASKERTSQLHAAEEEEVASKLVLAVANAVEAASLGRPALQGRSDLYTLKEAPYWRR